MGSGLLTKRGLADHYGVTVYAVNKWCRDGLPCASARGLRGAKLFDIEAVDPWLASRGIVPGAHGREGGKASQARRRKRAKKGRRKAGAHGACGLSPGEKEPAVTPAPAPTNGETLDDTLARLQGMEKALGEKVQKGLEGEGSTEGLAGLRSYTEIVNQLRQVVRGVREEQEKRGDLVPRAVFLGEMAALASLLKGGAQQLPVQVVSKLAQELSAKGVEVSDLRIFETALQGACEAEVDRWLVALSERVRDVGSSRAAGLGGGGGDAGAGRTADAE